MKILLLIQLVFFVHTVKSVSELNFFKQKKNDRLQYLDTTYKNTYKAKQMLSDNYNNKHLLFIAIDDDNDDSDELKPIARFHYDLEAKNKQAKDALVMAQHKARVNEVINFMEDHMLTTKYLYDEVKRIQRDKQVKDDLREMVSYLDRPQHKDEKEAVLKCFIRNKNIYTGPKKNIWDQKTNDLVINKIKDPFNDGVIN